MAIWAGGKAWIDPGFTDLEFLFWLNRDSISSYMTYLGPSFLALLLLPSVLSSQPKQSSTAKLPENFSEVFLQVFGKLLKNPDDLKLHPVVPGLVKLGVPPTKGLQIFEWNSVILPGANVCVIQQQKYLHDDNIQSSSTSNISDPAYECQFDHLGIARISEAVQMSLGPEWGFRTIESNGEHQQEVTTEFFREPPPEPVFASHNQKSSVRKRQANEIHLLGYKNTNVTLLHMKHIEREKPLEIPCSASKFFIHPQEGCVPDAPAPTVENHNPQTDIDGIISRISTNPHSPLPPIGGRSGSGPLVIRNMTDFPLTVYLSGPSTQRVLLGAHESGTFAVTAGSYKVAGEISEKSVQPFYGTRFYTGGEQESFYISGR